jgi:hypothetical protein
MVLDTSQSVPGKLQREVEQFVKDARTVNSNKNPNDRRGYVTVAKDGFVQSLPQRGTDNVERQHIGRQDQTNLAGGINLALAVKPNDAAYRLVLASDGLETSGNILQAAEAATGAARRAAPSRAGHPARPGGSRPPPWPRRPRPPPPPGPPTAPGLLPRTHPPDDPPCAGCIPGVHEPARGGTPVQEVQCPLAPALS